MNEEETKPKFFALLLIILTIIFACLLDNIFSPRIPKNENTTFLPNEKPSGIALPVVTAPPYPEEIYSDHLSPTALPTKQIDPIAIEYQEQFDYVFIAFQESYLALKKDPNLISNEKWQETTLEEIGAIKKINQNFIFKIKNLPEKSSSVIALQNKATAIDLLADRFQTMVKKEDITLLPDIENDFWVLGLALTF